MRFFCRLRVLPCASHRLEPCKGIGNYGERSNPDCQARSAWQLWFDQKADRRPKFTQGDPQFDAPSEPKDPLSGPESAGKSVGHRSLRRLAWAIPLSRRRHATLRRPARTAARRRSDEIRRGGATSGSRFRSRRAVVPMLLVAALALGLLAIGKQNGAKGVYTSYPPGVCGNAQCGVVEGYASEMLGC